MKPQSFAKLEVRKQHTGFRSLSNWQDKIDFFSNDYLGISRLLADCQLAGNGSTGSRLLSGNSPQAATCERFLADFFQSQAALVFNSGYDANLGLFSCIARREDTIIYDASIHASIRDGIRLSHAKSFSFQHNDLEDLQKKLKVAGGDVYVAVESLYSMDGDFAPLKELCALCQEKQLFLIVDEAHSGGIVGSGGRGLTSDLELLDSVFARIITFGKAYGTHGAVVLGSQDLKNYLINFARSFIYTTALPADQYRLIQDAVKLTTPDSLRSALQKNIHSFRGLMKLQLKQSDKASPIQILHFGNTDQTVQAARFIQERGFGVKAILSPTVPTGKECLRVCIHSFNTESEIEALASVLHSIS